MRRWRTLNTVQSAVRGFDLREMLLFRKRNERTEKYDPDRQEPVIKASICNGEQVAGFRDMKTGKFEEIMFIRKPSDIEDFKKEYGIEGEIRKEY